MNETHLRDLITRLVAELIGSTPTPRNAVVLVTGALLGFDEALASLARIGDDLHLDWTQTPSATRILDQQAIGAVGMTPVTESLVTSHDLLILPTLTVNMVAKVAHGIGDCLASNVIAEFVMAGKPVVAVTNAACPDSADKRGWFPAMPDGYAALLRENLSRFASFGVTLTSAATLDSAVRRVLGDGATEGGPDCDLKVISASVVETVEPGARLRIRHDALVTDLAQEAAAASGITLERV